MSEPKGPTAARAEQNPTSETDWKTRRNCDLSSEEPKLKESSLGALPFIVAQGIEFWNAGKKYNLNNLGNEQQKAKFVQLLAQQNDASDAYVVLGPAFDFTVNPDEPERLYEPGYVGIYYAVGNESDPEAAKKDNYTTSLSAWDGVTQLAYGRAMMNRNDSPNP